MQDGQPRYVTALAESDEPAGWRPTKAHGGCVIDVDSEETIARSSRCRIRHACFRIGCGYWIQVPGDWGR